jgi:hypothetical protein
MDDLNNRCNAWQRKPKCSEETCPSASLSTTNPIWPDQGLRGGKPATNRLCYGTAKSNPLLKNCEVLCTRIIQFKSHHVQQTTNSVAFPHERIPTERPTIVGEVSANFADRGCRVVISTDPDGRILGSQDRSRYCFFQVVPLLYSRGWVDPVPDLLRKSGSAGNRTRDLWICSQELWSLDHRGGQSRHVLLVKVRPRLDRQSENTVVFFRLFATKDSCILFSRNRERSCNNFAFPLMTRNSCSSL